MYFLEVLLVEHRFPGTLRNCIVVMEICSGMGATNFNFMASTNFSLLTVLLPCIVPLALWYLGRRVKYSMGLIERIKIPY